jgi:pSer/pThr/pTyr-binding forkhead associated (FHA) protein
MSGSIVFILRALLAVVLYAFLAWVLITLWREIKQQSAFLVARKIPPISLSIQSGGSPPILRHFHQPEITIGRNPACECPVDDDSVSSRHARLCFHHGQWWLQDMESTNNTYLNNEKLLIPTVIISGDKVRCGDTLIQIAFSGDLLVSPTRRLT